MPRYADNSCPGYHVIYVLELCKHLPAGSPKPAVPLIVGSFKALHPVQLGSLLGHPIKHQLFSGNTIGPNSHLRVYQLSVVQVPGTSSEAGLLRQASCNSQLIELVLNAEADSPATEGAVKGIGDVQHHLQGRTQYSQSINSINCLVSTYHMTMCTTVVIPYEVLRILVGQEG